MDWKFSDDRPIWLQLSEQLARRIVTGTYPPGSKLPSVRELAAEAGVNPNTMQRALAQLEQDGLAKADRTAGRTVTGDDREVAVRVEGPGVLAGLGSGNPCTPENYGTGRRMTWRGRALAVLRAGKEPGTLCLKVSAEGLPEESLTVEVSAVLTVE